MMPRQPDKICQGANSGRNLLEDERLMLLSSLLSQEAFCLRQRRETYVLSLSLIIFVSVFAFFIQSPLT